MEKNYLKKEIKEFFNNVDLEMTDKNIKEFEKVFNFIKKGLTKEIIKDIKKKWE